MKLTLTILFALAIFSSSAQKTSGTVHNRKTITKTTRTHIAMIAAKSIMGTTKYATLYSKDVTRSEPAVQKQLPGSADATQAIHPRYCRPPLSFSGGRGSETTVLIEKCQFNRPSAYNYDAYPINKSEPSSYILTREQIATMPTMSLNDLITIVPGVYQQRRGDNISIFGSRNDGIKYIIDGMQ